MYERRRLHPVSILLSILSSLKDTLLPVIVIIFSTVLQGKAGLLIWIWIGIPSFLGVLAGWRILSWLRYVYYLEADVFRVERGVLFRQQQSIALSRIQTVDITEGLIQRMFGVVKLQIQTAGGQKPEAVLTAVAHAEANELRRLLMENKEGAVQHVNAAEQPNSLLAELEQIPLLPAYRLTFSRLWIMAATSGSIGVVASFLVAAFSQAGNLFDEDQLLGELYDWMLGFPLVTLVIVVLAIAWILGMTGTVLKYYGFAIQLSGDKLQISRGLLERRQVAIPLSRIQAIRIVESPLRQLFGWSSIYVESAGYGTGKGESTLLFPLLKKSELASFLSTIVPQFPIHYRLHPLPRRSFRKYLASHIIVAILLAAPSCFVLPWGLPVLLLIPLSAGWGLAKYRGSGWVWMDRDRTLIIRSRFISRTVVYVPRNRIQHFQLSQSPLQRKSGLSTFRVTVASNGVQGSSFTIKHIDNAEGICLLDTLRPGK